MTRLLRVLIAANLALMAVTAAAPAAVVTGGVLTDANGAPTAGQVNVYGWAYPAKGKTVEMPLLGSATAGPDGRFTVSTLNDNPLRTLSAPRGGWLDFAVVGRTASYTGSWGFTGFVDAPGGQARVSSADAALGSAAVASSVTRAPFVTIHATQPTALASASQIGRCDTRMHVRAVGSMRKLTLIGELNNAYNDGTKGKLTYGRQNTSETIIGAAQKFENGSWAISAEYLISNAGKLTFNANKRYSRKLRSLFEYTKYETQSSSCAVWEPMIRATSWIGDQDDTIKQDGLDKCDPKFLVGYKGGDDWSRVAGNAVRFTRAVEAFGVNLTARSGFSKNVTLDYTWGGATAKKHYLCGQDGKASPFEAGRVMSGARK